MSTATHELPKELRPWLAVERQRAADELRAMVSGTIAQWRASINGGGTDGQTFNFDLRRIDRIENARPVFVLGEARSGTTAMLRAFRDGAGFFAWSEGHLFSAVPPLLTGLRFHLEQYRQRAAHAERQYAIDHLDIYRVLNAMVSAFDATYATAAGGRRWADKTPDAAVLLAVPLLAHVYPNGRFVFMHRHPIKLILSRLKKFPTSPIECGINAWAATMHLWRELKSFLPP